MSRHTKTILALAAMSAVLAMAAFAALASPDSGLPSSYADDYLIGPEDVLKITVWDNDDLTAEVRVGLDGNMSSKFTGKIQAAGLTVTGLSDKIAEILASGYIKDPQVSIQVVSYKSKKVFILGEVNKPGTYYLNRRTTLVEAISMAQGITKDADTEVTIVRKAVGWPGLTVASEISPEISNAAGPSALANTPASEISNAITLITDLRKALEGDLTQNILVRDEDSVYVPKAKTFFIMGEVNKPGQYKLERDTTVLKAVSIAGGHTEKAALNRITVIRIIEGKEVEREVALDEPVQPFDTLQVPQSYF